MSLYALIQNSTVAELFTPPSGFTIAECFAPEVVAQFVDVTNVLPVPQPGWSAAQNGAVWTFVTPPAPPAPTPAQAATIAYAALIDAGLSITSTSTVALNGTYNVQSGVPFGQEDIATEAQFISMFGEFTNGTTDNLSWPLLNGNFVTFPTTVEFLAFAKAIGQFIATAKLAMGQAATMPNTSIIIA